MTEHIEPNATSDKLPKVIQKIRLRCKKCGTANTYQVGMVICEPAARLNPSDESYSYTDYFRCTQCNGPGPWAIDDPVRKADLARRFKQGDQVQGLAVGKTILFDYTSLQTPAMSEDYLLKKIEQAPHDGFLHTRLGNLLRGCGQEAKSIHWYRKALVLDPGDIEARYHLFSYATVANDLPSAIFHAPLLVGSILEGRTTGKPELDEGMAFSVVDNLLGAPDEFRRHFLSQRNLESKEIVFIRTLLEATGDDKEIAQDAAERLLSGKPAPEAETFGPSDAGLLPEIGVQAELHPSLRHAVESGAMDPFKLMVQVTPDSHKRISIPDRHSLVITDGMKTTHWRAPSLRELFRGNGTPPADVEYYPPEYVPLFSFIEMHVLAVCDAIGDRTDQEMEDIYTALAKRPDGRSLGVVHDAVWQFAALLLGRRPMSEAEYTALFSTLTRSTRKWALRPVSRYYVAYLRNPFDHI